MTCLIIIISKINREYIYIIAKLFSKTLSKKVKNSKIYIQKIINVKYCIFFKQLDTMRIFLF